MDDNTFGRWLDDQLRRSGVSRRELADAIEASLGTINAWVGGYRWISPENADRVAEFFGESRNVVREMAHRPPVGGPVPGLIGLRGSSGLTGVTSVAFVPIIGAAPYTASRPAELGDVMPFAAEYAARFKRPGIIIITDESLAHRGIRRGEGLLIEQEFEAEQIRAGALVVLRAGPEQHFSVATWYVDEAGVVTLIPASETGPPVRFDPDEDACPTLVGLVRSVFSVRSID